MPGNFYFRQKLSGTCKVARGENIGILQSCGQASPRELDCEIFRYDISRWHSSYCVCSSGSGYSDMAIMANGDIALVYERGDSDYPGEKIIFRIVKNPLSYRN